MTFIFFIIVLILLLIYELYIIIIYNLYIKVRNLDLKFKDSFKLDVDKFKKASDEEKMSIISALLLVGGGALGAEVLKEDVLSHMKTPQRTGKEKFILNKEKLETLVNNIGEVDKEEDIGIKLVTSLNELYKSKKIKIKKLKRD